MWPFQNRTRCCKVCGAALAVSSGPGGGSVVCPNGCTALFYDRNPRGVVARVWSLWWRVRDGDLFTKVLQFFIGYFAVSCLTLPFIGRVWLGELPLLALIQLPKTGLANWVRKDVVMPALKFLGLSQGSFSPDYILARPYALAIVYLLPMIIIAVIGLRRSPSTPDRRRFLTIAFLIAATIDYLFTLFFADGRHLTIY